MPSSKKTTLDFGRRMEAALDALDQLADVPNLEIRHDQGRIVFDAASDDPRMQAIYEHLRRRGVAWLGPGRSANPKTHEGPVFEVRSEQGHEGVFRKRKDAERYAKKLGGAGARTEIREHARLEDVKINPSRAGWVSGLVSAGLAVLGVTGFVLGRRALSQPKIQIIAGKVVK